MRFGINAHEICEKFVYKHSESIECNKIKISLLFKNFTNFTSKKLQNS